MVLRPDTVCRFSKCVHFPAGWAGVMLHVSCRVICNLSQMNVIFRAVGRRLATLKASGALFYDTDLLPERLGYRLNAMLWLSVTPRYIHQVGEEIAAHPEIPFAAAISGRNNLVAVAICRDTQDLYRYLTDHLAPIKHVLTSDIRIRTQFLKQHGSIIAQGRLINPKPPAPRSAQRRS